MGSEVLRMVDAAEKDYQQKIMAQEMASNVNVVGIATEAVSGLQDERTSDTEMPVAEHKASEQEQAVEEQAAQEALDVSSRKAAQLVKKPKQLVTAQVVDAFCHILNMNEMYKAEQSPLRLLVPHHVTVYVLRHSNSEEREQHFKKFVRDFDDVLGAYDHIKFNDVDLVKYLLHYKFWSLYI
ncbi:hypothetical protein ACET3Z_031465 [Daucus carota]